MTTGEKIRNIRKTKGMTQKELGALLGITASTVAQFENSQTPPKFSTLERIAAALEVHISTLITYSKTPSDIAIDQKLEHIGYKTHIETDYEHGEEYLILDYPDGSLEVSPQTLEMLNKEADHYILFLLERLKQERINNFRAIGGKKNAEKK